MKTLLITLSVVLLFSTQTLAKTAEEIEQVQYDIQKFPQAWEITKGSKDVTVLVIDSETEHGIFTNSLISGKNFLTGRQETKGYAPNLNVIHSKDICGEWGCDKNKVEALIRETTKNKSANIINISAIIFASKEDTFTQALIEAKEAGINIIFASRNSYRNKNYDYCKELALCIGGIYKSTPLKMSDRHTPYNDNALLALSYYPTGAKAGGGTKRKAGNSFAAPAVSSAIGLMLSVNPNLTPDKIKEILQSTGQTVSNSDFKALNTYEAVKKAKNLLSSSNTSNQINLPNTLIPDTEKTPVVVENDDTKTCNPQIVIQEKIVEKVVYKDKIVYKESNDPFIKWITDILPSLSDEHKLMIKLMTTILLK